MTSDKAGISEEYTFDAWKRLHDLYDETTATWDVRDDLKVRAMGPNRHVELTVGRSAKMTPGAPREPYAVTERNVSTMRELAWALLDACDFVEDQNPAWASKLTPTSRTDSRDSGGMTFYVETPEQRDARIQKAYDECEQKVNITPGMEETLRKTRRAHRRSWW